MPRRKRAAWVAASLFLLIGALSAWLLRGDGARSAASAARPAPSATVAADAVPDAVATAAAAPRAAARPLPPPGTALETIATDLAARADAGEAGAACRLSLELLRCRQLLRAPGAVSGSSRRQAVQAETLGDARSAERLLWEGDRMAAVEDSCRAISPALLERAPHWLRQAALAGDREALLQYIDGRNLFPPMDFSYVDEPHFDRWRREAPALLQQALADGEPQAAIWLAEGRGGGDGAIQGLLSDDPERARTWLEVVDRLFGPILVMSVPVRPAAPEDEPRIAAMATRWHERWFDGRRVSLLDKPVLELLPNADPNAIDVGTRCGAVR